MKNKHLLLTSLMAIYLGLPQILGGQSSPAATNQLTETLSGRVVLKFDGTPQSGTKIRIFDEKNDKQYTLQQNAKGEFSISLPEGYYVVLITDLAFIPYAKEIRLEHGHPINLMVRLSLNGPMWEE